MALSRILVVRLGAMGDILHTLPAAATIKKSFPEARLAWAVHPRWMPLLEGGGLVDEIIPINRRSPRSIARAWRRLRREPVDVAIDFQGLVKSALVASVTRSARVIGYDRRQAREGAASLFYTETVHAESAHVVDRHLELVAAAGAMQRCYEAPLPPGKAESALPGQRFVLASPLAGWTSKQWPLEYYIALARLLREELGLPLVVNGSPASLSTLKAIEGAHAHVSSVEGLIDATRRAAAVVGVDSGPMHLAAALRKPGVALFGPTDPSRNGPYSKTLAMLRAPNAETTYERGDRISECMRALTPALVMDALRARLAEPHPVQRLS